MTDLHAVLRELRADLSELEDDEFVAKGRDLLGDQDRASILIAIFREFPSSLSGAMLTNLGFLFESLTYDDIIRVMLETGDEDLPSYHVARYVPEVFGVDVIAVARDIQRRYPEQQTEVQSFARLTQLIPPSNHALEQLRDAQASPERIRASLDASGAPLLPLPD